MIAGTLLSGMVAAGLVGHAIFVVATGIGALVAGFDERRTDRLAR